MNDPENFLSRWSRRKRDADAHGERDAEPGQAPQPDDKPGAREPEPAPSVEEFDIEQLPPIESIGADTDISDFLRPGVPEALRHAALRRVWSSDPAIRDFVGLNENFWDAGGAGGIPGFGDLDPGFDVKRLVAELFGERPREASPSEASPPEASPPEAGQEHPATSSQASENSNADTRLAESGTSEQERSAAQSPSSQRAENAAMQNQTINQEDGSAPAVKHGRRHGGAMPRSIDKV